MSAVIDPVLRRAGECDAPALASLCAETFKQAYAGVHSAANLAAYCDVNYGVAKLRALLSQPTTHCKVASRDGADVGYCILVERDCPIQFDAATIELKQIYILTSEYGSGLARLLFDDALKTTRTLGAERIWLAVADNNTRAQSFYRKLDFEHVGAGPVFDVGTDRLSSRILARSL